MTRRQNTTRNEALRALRDEGWTMDELAARFGITRQRVSQILGGDSRRMNNQTLTARNARVLELLRAGRHPAEVAAEVGLAEYTVRRVARKAGVALPSGTWDQARVMEAVLRWRMRHGGRWPEAADWAVAAVPEHPSAAFVANLFGSWERAMAATREWLDKAA